MSTISKSYLKNRFLQDKLLVMKTRYIPGLIYLSVSIALLFFKFFAYKMTSSDAIFSDAMESIVNVVAAAFAFYALYKSTQKTSQFPYGAGKIENISASVEGSLLGFASIAILFEVFLSVVKAPTVENLNVGIIIIAITGFANLLLGVYLKYESRRLQSQALDASGSHILSDVITTAGVIIGLCITQWTGWFFIDTAIAFVLAIFIAYLSVKHLKSAIGEMLDKEDLGLLKKLVDIFNKINQTGLIQIHHVKIIRSGPLHHIDAHFVLPEFWDVNKIHDEVSLLEKNINKYYGYEVEIGAHLDPCRKAYCKHCDLASCPIRKEDFIKKLPVTLEQMRSPMEPDDFMKD